MATCPKGHVSADDDYCSECGALIDKAKSALDGTDAPVSAGSAAVAAGTCPQCGEPRVGTAKFCEVCRYNFEHGAADIAVPPFDPTPVSPPVPPPLPPLNPSAGAARAFLRWRVSVAVDPTLCDDPVAAAQAPSGAPLRSFPLDMPELLIGRTDPKRGIHPEIQPDDSGISRRHAQFVRQPDGAYAVLDLNSMNGTKLNGTRIEPGVGMPVTDGDVITLGQWTRITIQGIES